MRVLVTNPYVFNKRGAALAAWLDDTGFDVALMNEMRRLHDDVRPLGHITSGQHGEMRNNVVLTRSRVDPAGTRVVKLCEGVEGSRVWKDRLYVRVVRDGVAYYCTHANAVIQKDGRWRDNAGARRWRQALPTLLKAIKADEDAGLEVVLGGDMNWRHTKGRVLPDSPEWLCRELGLKFVTTQVMWLAYSPGLRLTGWEKKPTPPGADGHPVIVADLEPVAAAPADPEPAEAEEKEEVEPVGRIPFIEAPNSGGNYDKNLLVVHVTISPEVKGAARGVIAFWRRGRTGSTQYVVDAHETIQAVRETAYAWAAGTHANRIGIHVELCGFIQTVRQWHDGYSTAELDRAARLFAELAVKYRIPIRKIGPAQIRKAYETGRPEDGGICGHVDISHTWPGDTSHTDPGAFFPWDEFLRLVRKYANDPRAETPTTEKDWFDMATKDDLREVVREEMDKLLDADMNRHEPKGTTRFRGMTLRELLKQIHVAVVNKPTE